MNSLDTTSTRPYLIRALYEWCTDNGLTPYVAVAVDDSVQVPREYVKNSEIVLNISFDATSSLKLSNEFIEFKARFAGSSREIMVPIDRVIAIYARENGQGMSFPMGSIGGERQEQSTGVAAVTTPLSVVGEPGADRSDEHKVVHLVPGDNVTTDEDPGGNFDPPEPTKPQKSGPPSLKRVK